MNVKEPILYVDDEDLNLKLFQVTLKNHFDVFTASSADKGMQIIRNNKIKVIVSDQRMPVKSGIEFLQEVSETCPNIIRILLTAFTSADTLFESINKGGVFKYITKPWVPENLITVLHDAVEIYNLKEENIQLVSDLQKKNEELEQINKQLLNENNRRKKVEEKLKNIFNSSTNLIIILNPDFEILETNFAFGDLLKYKKEEVIGQKIDFMIYPGDVLSFREKLNRLQAEEILSFFEFSVLTENKELIPMEMSARFMNYQGEKAILIIAGDIRERKEVEKKLLNAIIETEEKERQHFAEEIHDGLGPLISSMKFNLHILKEHKTGKKFDKAINNLFELVDESTINIKEISNQLSPYVLKDFGLTAALKSFCSKIKLSDQKEIIIHDQLNGLKLSDKNEVILYRVITELVNNTLKYAEASKIEISLFTEEKLLRVIYRDNGKGFKMDKIKNSGQMGYGLINIGNRLKSIGGNYELITDDHKGFLFNIKLTLQD